MAVAIEWAGVMNGVAAAVGLLLIAAGAAAAQALAFTNVTVVDVENGQHLRNQTVVIRGDRIATVGATARTRLPSGSRVVDGKGKFLIPGLWDLHVHETLSPHVPEWFVVNGVTGIRDMAGDFGGLLELRKAIGEGRRIGPPRIVACGPTLNGRPENALQVAVRTAEQGRQVVRQQVAQGVGCVKVYNGIDRQAYLAVADESRRLGVPMVGHTPDAVTTLEAAAAGQRSIEHLDGVLLDCSWDRARLRRERRFAMDDSMLKSFDATRAAQVFGEYARRGVWHCPTLSLFRGYVRMTDPAAAEGMPELRLFAEPWRPRPAAIAQNRAPLERAIQKKMMDVTAIMHRAGVRLLAGTDTGNPYVLPGFGLHEELELLAAAGIRDAAVLRIATSGAAQFLGREKDLGTASAGKLADLVLLDADPLQSIANTRRIHSVVAGGRLLDRAELDRIRTSASLAARGQ